MKLPAADLTRQLHLTTNTLDNLTSACQGILQTKLNPSPSAWYRPLQAQLDQAQALARTWIERHAGALRTELLTCVIHCGQGFQRSRSRVTELFALAKTDPEAAKKGLQAQFSELQAKTEMILDTSSNYESGLKSWGQNLLQIHEQIGATVAGAQAEAATIRSQIAALNAEIGLLQGEITRHRQAIAAAKAERDRSIVRTIFGVLLAPFSGGLSLILTGIGVASIAAAESKVAAMQKTMEGYQMRIIAAQANMTQEQVQVATLQALLLPAGIALSDTNVASQLLGDLRVTWHSFLQELLSVMAKIAKAQNAEAILLEQAWFNAACAEWDLIRAGAEEILGAPITERSVTCDKCDVPVVQILPARSYPTLPSDLKLTVLVDPNRLDAAPDVQVLNWGEFTYWVASYIDNRVAFCFVGFDGAGKLVKRVEKEGARYLWRLQLDPSAKNLTATGQAGRAVTASLAELAIR